jgi:hypothetical protein
VCGYGGGAEETTEREHMTGGFDAGGFGGRAVERLAVVLAWRLGADVRYMRGKKL